MRACTEEILSQTCDPKGQRATDPSQFLLCRHSPQLKTQKGLLCPIPSSFFWASEKSQSCITVITSEGLRLGCPNSIFLPTLPRGCWDAASPDHIVWVTEPGFKNCRSISQCWTKVKSQQRATSSTSLPSLRHTASLLWYLLDHRVLVSEILYSCLSHVEAYL